MERQPHSCLHWSCARPSQQQHSGLKTQSCLVSDGPCALEIWRQGHTKPCVQLRQKDHVHWRTGWGVLVIHSFIQLALGTRKALYPASSGGSAQDAASRSIDACLTQRCCRVAASCAAHFTYSTVQYSSWLGRTQLAPRPHAMLLVRCCPC
jgi:hypothetical protein